MSDSEGSRRRLPRPATVLAAIAVFAALVGTATAAKGLINGNQIKRGTITGKQIKNKSLALNKFNAAAVKGLRGPEGPRGEKGETGPKGPTGIIAPLFGEDENANIAKDGEVLVLTVGVPSAGTFVINAKTNLFSLEAGSSASCGLLANDKEVDRARWTNDEASGRQTVAMQAVATATPADPLEVHCAIEDSSGSASETKLTAIPVS